MRYRSQTTPRLLDTPTRRFHDALRTSADRLKINEKLQRASMSLHRRSKTPPIHLQHGSKMAPGRSEMLQDDPKTHLRHLDTHPNNLKSLPRSLKTSSMHSLLQNKYRSSPCCQFKFHALHFTEACSAEPCISHFALAQWIL